MEEVIRSKRHDIRRIGYRRQLKLLGKLASQFCSRFDVSMYTAIGYAAQSATVPLAPMTFERRSPRADDPAVQLVRLLVRNLPLPWSVAHSSVCLSVPHQVRQAGSRQSNCCAHGHGPSSRWSQKTLEAHASDLGVGWSGANESQYSSKNSVVVSWRVKLTAEIYIYINELV